MFVKVKYSEQDQFRGAKLIVALSTSDGICGF